jgi:hypothetical protein
MSEQFLQTTAKSKIYVGPVATVGFKELADFEAIDENDWKEIGSLIDLGKWGAEGNEITQGFINDAFVHRLKGNLDNGKIEVVVARDPFNEGQKILRQAVNGNWNKYAIRVILNDQPTDTGTPSTFYFKGVPLSAQNDFGEVNNVVKTALTLGIDGELFEVPADVTIVWTPAGPALTAGVDSTPYSETVAASGGVGVPSYSLKAGDALPAGLTLSASGVISGTPSATGVSTFSVVVTFSGFGEDEHEYGITVTA